MRSMVVHCATASFDRVSAFPRRVATNDPADRSQDPSVPAGVETSIDIATPPRSSDAISPPPSVACTCSVPARLPVRRSVARVTVIAPRSMQQIESSGAHALGWVVVVGDGTVELVVSVGGGVLELLVVVVAVGLV